MRSWGTSAAVAVLLLAAKAARAEAVTPPVVREAPVPACVHADAEGVVRVDAVVGVSGEVGDVDVVSGEPPFVEPALEAARHHHFGPAMRGDVAVASKIRLELHVPVCAEVKPTPPSATPAPEPKPSAPPKPNEPDNALVHGRRETYTPTERTISRADIRSVPGAFGDPFRAIDVLPGLVPTISGLPFYYVRGAPPSTVGYYVDEVRVPYLFHFALGPGVIHPALVDAVSVHPAAFPGRFGRFSGAIVEGRTKDAPTELRGEGQIRLLDAGAYVESPLAGGKASVGVGGRFSYTAALISLLAQDITLDYRDYNARASYALDDRTRVSLFTFGSFDYASQRENGVDKVAFATEFHRVDLRLDHVGSDRSQSRVAMTFGLDRTRLEDRRFARDWVLGLRARHRKSVTDALDVEVGADTLIDFYSGDLPSIYAVGKQTYDDALLLFAPRTDTATGAWIEAKLRPGAGVELTTTLRGDVFTSAGRVLVGPSPRASMRVPLGSRVAFLGALGIAPQPPAFAIPIPAVGYRGLPGGLSFGYQKSAGFEVELPLRFRGSAVGFHHSYLALRDFTQDKERSTIELPNDPAAGSPAQAYGLEAMLGRRLGERYTAFASYTLSRSVRGSTSLVGSEVSPFDRTHVLQVGGAVDLGRRWRLSSRMVTYTGWPTLSLVPGAASRLPAFLRFDARLEKSWSLRKNGSISLVFEGLNVTGAKETLKQTCDEHGCRAETFGPVIVPSIGVEAML